MDKVKEADALRRSSVQAIANKTTKVEQDDDQQLQNQPALNGLVNAIQKLVEKDLQEGSNAEKVKNDANVKKIEEKQAELEKVMEKNQEEMKKKMEEDKREMQDNLERNQDENISRFDELKKEVTKNNEKQEKVLEKQEKVLEKMEKFLENK